MFDSSRLAIKSFNNPFYFCATEGFGDGGTVTCATVAAGGGVGATSLFDCCGFYTFDDYSGFSWVSDLGPGTGGASLGFSRVG